MKVLDKETIRLLIEDVNLESSLSKEDISSLQLSIISSMINYNYERAIALTFVLLKVSGGTYTDEPMSLDDYPRNIDKKLAIISMIANYNITNKDINEFISCINILMYGLPEVACVIEHKISEEIQILNRR